MVVYCGTGGDDADCTGGGLGAGEGAGDATAAGDLIDESTVHAACCAAVPELYVACETYVAMVIPSDYLL
jgi:hypothetical protein